MSNPPSMPPLPQRQRLSSFLIQSAMCMGIRRMAWPSANRQGVSLCSTSAGCIPVSLPVGVSGSGFRQLLLPPSSFLLPPSSLLLSQGRRVCYDDGMNVKSFCVLASLAAPAHAAPITFTHMADASAGETAGPGMIVVANDEDNLLRVYRLPDGGAPVTAWDLAPHMSLEKKSPEMDIEGSARLDGSPRTLPTRPARRVPTASASSRRASAWRRGGRAWSRSASR